MTARLVATPDARLLPWAAQCVGIECFRDDAKAIGLERDGQLVAVVVFDGFTSTDCNMHISSDGTGRWMNKELLRAAFAYPFVQLGYRRVTGLVPDSNARALAFNEHLGFAREGLHRLAADDGGHIVSMGLLRSECRFISKEFRHV